MIDQDRIMSLHHDHHSHAHNHNDGLSRIGFAFFLNLIFTIIELFGGIWTNSMAILADALHDLGDSLSLGLSFVLEKASRKKRDIHFSYGYGRLSLLGALINGVVLVIGSVLILKESIPAILNPREVDANGMFILAIIGIVFNGIGVFRLIRGRSLNEQVMAWHLIEDVLGWVGILTASVVMMFFDVPVIDPVLSILFIIITLWNAIRLLKQTLKIFLQGVPASVDIDDIETRILDFEGVASVHDTHVWSLDGDTHILTTHVVLEDEVDSPGIFKIKELVRQVVREMRVNHATIEVERKDEECHLRNC